MTSPAPLRWGIVATGWISGMFVGDLVVDPSKRSVTDGTAHQVVAVASRSVAKAEEFVGQFPALKGKGVKCYGDYTELYADPNVEAVYIGTPHSHHYENAKDAIRAKKAILLEKPSTITAKQSEHLVKLAKENGVFFMEAVWTRLHPLTLALKKDIEDGAIGEVLSLHSTFANDADVEKKLADGHRLVVKDLAGGSILDQGPYTFLYLPLLFPAIFPKDGSLPLISATSALHRTGIDVTTSVTLANPDDSRLSAVMSTSLARITPLASAVEIVGTRGVINVDWPPYKPEAYTVNYWDTEKEIEGFFPASEMKAKMKTRRVEKPQPEGVFGFGWEADETARCIRAGKLESAYVPWKDTIMEMAVFDATRKAIGLDYGAEMEACEKF